MREYDDRLSAGDNQKLDYLEEMQSPLGFVFELGICLIKRIFKKK